MNERDMVGGKELNQPLIRDKTLGGEKVAGKKGVKGEILNSG